MNFIENDIDSLIAKDLSKEISADEKIILNDWLNRSTENQTHYNHFKKLFETSSELKHHEAFDTDAAWNQLKQKIKKQNQAKVFQFNWRIAASVAILLLAGIFVYTKFLIPQDSIQLNSDQQVSEKSLPDGTTVFLNKNTAVSYHYDPLKKIRKTELQGEAFFEIAKQDKQDFLLEVNGLLIKDIGTAFNVKAYPDSDTVEVYVETGEVVFYSALDSGLHLKANETGFYNKKSNTFSKRLESNENALAYKTQILVFDNTQLSEVVDLVNEVYDVKLKLGKKEIENCRITVTFRHETIDMIAEVIAETLSLTLEKTEHEITLTGKGCTK